MSKLFAATLAVTALVAAFAAAPAFAQLNTGLTNSLGVNANVGLGAGQTGSVEQSTSMRSAADAGGTSDASATTVKPPVRAAFSQSASKPASPMLLLQHAPHAFSTAAPDLFRAPPLAFPWATQVILIIAHGAKKFNRSTN